VSKNGLSTRFVAGPFNRSVRLQRKSNREGTANAARQKRERQQKTTSAIVPGSRGLISRVSDSSTTGSSMYKFIRQNSWKPVGDWSTEDACDWLKFNQLDDDSHLSAQFRALRINGTQLVDPENAWNCMNGLRFKNDRQKQDVLLKLAEYLRESRMAMSGTLKPDNALKRPMSAQQIRPPSSLSRSESFVSSSDYASGSSSSSTTVLSASSSEQARGACDEVRSVSATNASSKVKKTLTTLKQRISKARPSTVLQDEQSPMNTMHSIVVHSDLKQQGRFYF